MTWRKEKPKDPGWYWWRMTATTEPEIVEVTTKEAADPQYWQVRFRIGQNILGLVVGEWYGPLKAPA